MHGVAEVLCNPLFGIDLWEHAYFHAHMGNKAAYCDEFLSDLDWSKLSHNYENFALKSQCAPLNI